jgi:hypothetical protein
MPIRIQYGSGSNSYPGLKRPKIGKIITAEKNGGLKTTIYLSLGLHT